MQVKLVQPQRQIAVETEGFILFITAAERGLRQSQVGHAGLEEESGGLSCILCSSGRGSQITLYLTPSFPSNMASEGSRYPITCSSLESWLVC